MPWGRTQLSRSCGNSRWGQRPTPPQQRGSGETLTRPGSGGEAGSPQPPALTQLTREPAALPWFTPQQGRRLAVVCQLLRDLREGPTKGGDHWFQASGSPAPRLQPPPGVSAWSSREQRGLEVFKGPATVLEIQKEEEKRIPILKTRRTLSNQDD